jgi:transposase
MGSRLSLVRLVFQLAESNDSDRRLTRSWSPSKAMKTNKNRLAAIRLMIKATNKNLRQWRRMKLGRAFVVTDKSYV